MRYCVICLGVESRLQLFISFSVCRLQKKSGSRFQYWNYELLMFEACFVNFCNRPITNRYVDLFLVIFSLKNMNRLLYLNILYF